MSQDSEDSRPSFAPSWLQIDVHPQVFFVSAGVILAFVVLTLFFAADLDTLFAALQAGISRYAGWFFVATLNIVLIFIISLLLGRFGSIRLGGEGAVPEFSTPAWISMLFSAGMGIGLLFYGVAGPMFHFAESPLAEPGTAQAARTAGAEQCVRNEKQADPSPRRDFGVSFVALESAVRP
jgi:choline/glycine/proline betaine transport protein